MTIEASTIVCFGEVLWDCLPEGDFLGGAPLNVAYQLNKLGAQGIIVSSVGRDALGEKALAQITALGLSTEFVGRLENAPTGRVLVTLNEAGDAAYTIEENVAWDAIALTPELTACVQKSAAIVFGSLAARGKENLKTLRTLLGLSGPLKVMDVNLRPPFDNPDVVKELARQADLVKMNEEELVRLTTDSMNEPEPSVETRIEHLRSLLGNKSICITRGAQGAIAWSEAGYIYGKAPAVEVVDTVGAGDAFTAALIEGVLNKVPWTDAFLNTCCRVGSEATLRKGALPCLNTENG